MMPRTTFSTDDDIGGS